MSVWTRQVDVSDRKGVHQEHIAEWYCDFLGCKAHGKTEQRVNLWGQWEKAYMMLNKHRLDAHNGQIWADVEIFINPLEVKRTRYVITPDGRRLVNRRK